MENGTEEANKFCEEFINISKKNGSYLDKDNILWKTVNGIWTGKRAIQKFDCSVSWFENTKTEDIKMWLHGKEANYNETFYREI